MAFFVLCVFAGSLVAQERIDGTVNFQTDPRKKFSLYIPSSYDASTPNAAFLALHPWNTARWNARTWRDTLSHFAEVNGLILIAPDGGLDGQVDDQIDTAFATYLLDSMNMAYNINQDEVYVIGFSWGGRTTYTYGLSNADRFAGYIPIGAAINGTSEIMDIVNEAKDEKFYIIHGSNDRPGTRFTPARRALMNEEACVEDTLLSGVGHTIDFAGRNDLLNKAYKWLKSTNCGTTSTADEQKKRIDPISLIMSRPEFQNSWENGHWLRGTDVSGRIYQSAPSQSGFYICQTANTLSWQRVLVTP